MFDRMTIRVRLIALFVLSVSFLTVLAGINWYSQRQTAQSMLQVQKASVDPLLQIQAIESALKEIRFRIAGVLLDQLPTVGANNHLTEARTQINTDWQGFKGAVNLATMPAAEAEQVAALDKGIATLPAYFDKVAAAYKASDKAVLGSLLEDEWPIIHSKVVKPLGQLIPSRVAETRRTFDSNAALGQRLNTIALISYLVCAAILAVLVLPMVRSINSGIRELRSVLGRVAKGDLDVRPNTSRGDELGDMARAIDETVKALHAMVQALQESSNALSGTAQQLGAEVHQLRDRRNSSTNALGRATQSVERMAHDAQEISGGASEVANASDTARNSAATGSQRMDQSIEATAKVQRTVEESAVVIVELAESTDRINQITQVIREIADQTNLLALNAAIEAARAGEQGRGFAVVADEVRKLAERTASSTTDISTTVDAIRARTSSAVAAMDRARGEVAEGVGFNLQTQQSLRDIVDASAQVSSLAERIAESTRHQLTNSAASSSDINEVASLNDADNQSMVSVDAVANQVGNMARELQNVIGRFKL
jgi:methyl-accepting chemotaxis protein